MIHPGYAHIKFGALNPNVAESALARTIGARFMPVYLGAKILGMHYYTHATEEKEYKFSLWRPDNATPPRSTTMALAGQTLHQIQFPSPYVVTEADMVKYNYNSSTGWYHVGVYETGAGDVTQVPVGTVYGEDPLGDSNIRNTIGNMWHVYAHHMRYYSSGDARPATEDTLRSYPISPIIHVDDASLLYSATPNTYIYGANNSTVVAASGNRTCGIRFWLYDIRAIVRGIRFYTHASGSHKVLCKLWNAGSDVAGTEVTCSGPGYYTATFTYSPSATQIASNNFHWYATVWETTGTVYTKATKLYTSNPWAHFVSPGKYINYTNDSNHYYAVGDALPNLFDGTEGYPIDPIIDNV